MIEILLVGLAIWAAIGLSKKEDKVRKFRENVHEGEAVIYMLDNGQYLRGYFAGHTRVNGNPKAKVYAESGKRKATLIFDLGRIFPPDYQS